MRSIRMMVWSNLKRTLQQSLLVGFTLAMSALLFSVSLGTLQSLRAPYERMFDRQHGSQISFFVSSELYAVDRLVNWWQSRAGVSGVSVIPCVQTGPEFPYVTPKGSPGARRAVEILFLASEYDPEGKLDRLATVDGDAKAAPGHGEVWLPTTVAMGINAKVGDTLEIPTPNGLSSLLVTAIVVDPQFSATSNMNPTRIWLGPGELSWHYPVGASQNVFVSVRLDRDEDVATQWQAFNLEVGGAFNGLYYARDDLLFYFAQLFNLIASGLLVVAIISLAISFFVIYTTIHGAVVADYRQIGVLKSLGFTPGGIMLGYSLQLLYITGIFVPLGLVGGYFAQQVIGYRLSRSIGLVNSEDEFGLLAILTFSGIAVFVFGASSLVARRAGKIKTVEAIRLGEAPEPQVKSRFFFGAQSRSPLVFLLALKTMFTRKRRLVLSGMTILLSTFVFAFCLNLNTFFASEGSRAEFWGSPKADFSISLQAKRFSVDHQVFVDDVSRNPDVSVFVAQSWIDFAIPERGKEKARVIYGVMVDGNMDGLGYWNLVGRNPTTHKEISLGVTTAKDYGLRPGDTLEGILAGKPLAFTVTGIFQFSGNAGRGFRMTEAGLRRADPTTKPSEYFVSLKDNSKKAAFQADLEHRYGGSLRIADVEVRTKQAIKAQADSVSAVLALVFALFVVIALVMLGNTTTMEVNESRRMFGIYKSLGMTSSQMRYIVALKTVLVSLVFGIAGMGIELALHRTLLELMLASFGIAKVGLNADFIELGCVVVLFALVCGGNAYLAASATRKISTRSLVLE